VGREILDQNCDVLDATAELFRERIQSLFRNVDEVFAFHRSAPRQTADAYRIACFVLVIVVTRIIGNVSFFFLFFFLFFLFLVWLFS
jgi:hypothetical protein